MITPPFLDLARVQYVHMQFDLDQHELWFTWRDGSSENRYQVNIRGPRATAIYEDAKRVIAKAVK